MSDLRSLLDHAVGGEPMPAPVADIRRRAVTLTRRRRLRKTAAAAAVLALVAVVAPRLTTVTASPATATDPRRVIAGPLAPGDHTAKVMDQQLRFTVPADRSWTAAAVEPDRLLLYNFDSGAAVEVLPWTGVHTFTAEGVAQKNVIPVPDDLVGWLTGHPGLRIDGAPSPVTLAGRPAQRVTIAIRPDYRPVAGLGDPKTPGCDRPADCIVLAETTGRPLILYPGSTITLVIQDGAAPKRLVLVSAAADDAPQAAASADPVIRSFSAGDPSR